MTHEYIDEYTMGASLTHHMGRHNAYIYDKLSYKI